MTEQQRMEEGRRMFQIFAARMFEQRVLSAYRDKVAKERQQRLLEELDEEEKRKEAQEARKALNAQKKKDKKQQQKQAKAEEKARKDAEKAAEEAAVRAAEEKKQEELKRKRDEQRKKKEAERKAQDEEKHRKEAERLRRQQEERERQQEAEKRNRELKVAEKKAKEDAKKKEREEREAREKEAREKKAHEEKMRKDAADAKAKVEREVKERTTREGSISTSTQPTKRGSVANVVALPPGLQTKQQSAIPSPAIPVATPALPKAPTPSRPRQSSQQDSHGSSPKTPQIQPGQNKPSSPPSAGSKHSNPVIPKTILARPPSGQQNPLGMLHQQLLSHPPNIGPPSNMPMPPGLYNGPPPGLNGLQRPPGQAMHLPQQNAMGVFPNQHQHPPMGGPYRNFSAPNGPLPPPGMGAPGMVPPIGRGFVPEAPPGFAGQVPGLAGANQMPPFGMARENIPSHSRQQSGSGSFENPAPVGSQPISRPAPIQRPSSVKPLENSPAKRLTDSELEDLSNHLGSSALLDDADDPILAATEHRQGIPPGMGGRGFPFAHVSGQSRMEPFGMGGGSTPSSTWGTPTIPFGPPPSMGNAPTWGTLPASNLGAGNWAPNPPAPFGGMPHRLSIATAPQPAAYSRPQQVRRSICDACKMLSATEGPSASGYHDVGSVLRQISLTAAPPSALDVRELCEAEGNEINGGGYFDIQSHDDPNLTRVKFIDVHHAPTSSAGVVGSPIQSNPRPFQVFSGVN